MATISFKTDDSLKAKLEALANRKGINTSAYIKLILTEKINGELIIMTENGLTVEEELRIINSDKKDKTSGPFKTAKAVWKALND